MDYNTSTPALRPSAGLVVVVGLHVLLVYALVSGLARQVVAVVQQPLDVKLLQEIKPPPPPPPEVKPPPPKAAAPRAPTPPPPAYVPPPEVPVPATVAPPITTVAAPPPPAPAPVPETAAPPAPPAPARVAAVIQASDCAKPEYPPLSLRREEAGTVRLRFLVSAEGKVIDSRVETSSGFPRLDEAARQALSQCKFKPGTVDGRPEQGWAGLNYTWRLE